MVIVDWFFMAVLLVSVALGALRGILSEALAFINNLVALSFAIWFTPDLAKLLQMTGVGSGVCYVFGFVFLFVTTVTAGLLLSQLHRNFFQPGRPKPVDRVFGSVMGLIRGVSLLLAATVFISISPLRTYVPWHESLGVSISNSALQLVKPYFSEELGMYLLNRV